MFNKQSIYLLIDLVEIKLSTIMIQDKEDLREVNRLKNCKKELMTLLKNTNQNEHKNEDNATNITVLP